jgi:hypothetical protein
MQNLMSRAAMSVRKTQVRSACKITLLWSLLGLSGALLAADTELPEMEFLEYLGLWEESDEDWILLTEEVSTQVAAEDTRIDTVSKGEESAESEDES